MEKIESIGIQAIISAALAAFASYLGALAVPIVVLIVMMVIDYLSGMESAIERMFNKCVKDNKAYFTYF